MASWAEFEAAAPEFSAAVKARFEARRHHTLATLRRDGSPRISGTEVRFRDGELWIGSMLDARKAHDLQRDPRYALHCGSADPPEWSGDAKVSGRVEEVTDPGLIEAVNGREDEASHLFRAVIEEAVLVHLNEAGDRLVVESWHHGRGVERVER